MDEENIQQEKKVEYKPLPTDRLIIDSSNGDKYIKFFGLIAILFAIGFFGYLVYNDHFKANISQNVTVNPAQVTVPISNNYQNSFNMTPIIYNNYTIVNQIKICGNSTC